MAESPERKGLAASHQHVVLMKEALPLYRDAQLLVEFIHRTARRTQQMGHAAVLTTAAQNDRISAAAERVLRAMQESIPEVKYYANINLNARVSS
jgi:hypothetical protein